MNFTLISQKIAIPKLRRFKIYVGDHVLGSEGFAQDYNQLSSASPLDEVNESNKTLSYFDEKCLPSPLLPLRKQRKFHKKSLVMSNNVDAS